MPAAPIIGMGLFSRGPSADEPQPDSEDLGQRGEGLDAACVALLSAIGNKDRDALADALRAAFYAMDSEPHDEGSSDTE